MSHVETHGNPYCNRASRVILLHQAQEALQFLAEALVRRAVGLHARVIRHIGRPGLKGASGNGGGRRPGKMDGFPGEKHGKTIGKWLLHGILGGLTL